MPRLIALILAVLAAACLAARAQAQVLYVSSDFSHEVLRYNPQTGALIDVFVSAGSGGLNQPHSIIDRGPDIIVASFGTDQVLRYDAATGAFLGVFISGATGLNDPVYMIHGPDGNLYISSQASDEILRYSPDGVFIDAFVSAGSGGLDGPSGFAFAPDGRLYVAGRYSADVLAYDGATGAFMETVLDASDGLTSGDTFGLQIGDNGDLYIASNGNGYRYDLDSHAMVGIPVGFPIGLENGPDGGVFVATSNNLRLIDTGDNSIGGPFLVGGAINLLNFFHFSRGGCSVCPGDMNGNGVVEIGDVVPFVDRLLDGMDETCPDADLSGTVDGLDISAFTLRLVTGQCGGT
ncbi:MAG: hypothetical protein HS101_13330 [Planctomycetia bacterium]|nr:hypothetical protein [Planctomycetia bacterium]